MKDLSLEGLDKAPITSFMGGYSRKDVINFKMPGIRSSARDYVLDRLQWYGDEVNISVRQMSAYTVMTIENRRLDASVITSFKLQIQDLIARGDKQIILDIRQLCFMDSSGLGALVNVMKKLDSQSNMVIVGVSGIVYDVFKITRMDQVFTLCDTLDLAIKHLGA